MSSAKYAGFVIELFGSAFPAKFEFSAYVSFDPEIFLAEMFCGAFRPRAAAALSQARL
jgi:hypothetical protein